MPSSERADKVARFRALHARAGAFVIPNPWDVGTARILAAMGYEALATTSAGHAFSFGRPDGAISRDEALDHARLIVGATPLPVSADLENCFADAPEEAAETIRLAAETGLAGASIEDASGDPSAPIYEFELALERVTAAVEVAQSAAAPFVLTARAENFLHRRPDLDDTIRRLVAFERAGADVLYAPGLTTIEAIQVLCEAVSKPVNVVVGLGAGTFTVDELAAAGVKRISLGSALARAAFGAFLRAAREVNDDGTFAFADDAVPFREITKLLS